MQGRNLHWPSAKEFDGSHFDYFFRDLASPSQNPDIRSIDRLIDELAAGGRVDPNRIYITGWSDGATFAMFYAIARHGVATPGGNRVAAAAVYAGYDPFNNLIQSQSPSCQLDRYPTSTAPIYIIHRACDALVACDAAQQQMFGLPPGDDVEGWEATLASTGHDSQVSDRIIDFAGRAAAACAPASECTSSLGFTNHLHWPDGISDGSGWDWEPEILAFLRNHSLQ
jgi:hypothetical protein